MQIVYFYQYFSTPKGSWGTRVYEFASDWVKKGHEVTVVTSVYSKSDIKATSFIDTQNFNGINVKIINVEINNKQHFIKRILSFIQYALVSSWFAITLKADIIIASSGPITVGIPGLIAKFFRGRKLVFETRDLWPEGAIELGIISNPFIKKIAYWFERICYRNSSFIVCLSPGMVQNIKRRFGYQNLISVPNSADLKLFGDRVNSDLPAIFNGKKVAIYTGNIGMVNNSFLLIRAAEKLKEIGRNDILIVLVGDGQQKAELIKFKSDKQLDNFVILDLMPKNKLVNLIQHSFVSLVPLRGTPVLDTSSPNKLFESLAAGVPVIQNTNGWIKDLLLENNCGFTVDADNENELVEKLIELATNHELHNLMSTNARILAEQEFDKNILSQKMLTALEKVNAG